MPLFISILFTDKYIYRLIGFYTAIEPMRQKARLLEQLSTFLFDLKFQPGKEMLVSDSLSWLQNEDKSNVHGVMPLNFLQHE